MKKIFSSITVLSLFILGGQMVVPNNAHAVLLVEMAMDHHPIINLPEVVLCIIVLPICLLDEKSAPPTAYSQQDLIDNGYGATQVSSIERDQGSIMSALQTQNLTMVIEKTDTYTTIAQGLRGIDPLISTDYIDFVADINHVDVPQN